MWLCTKHGFFSVKRDYEDRYFIRARRRGDLENLIDLMKLRWVGSPDEADLIRSPDELDSLHDCTPYHIHEWPEADYRFRLIVSHKALMAVYAQLAEGIDYANFKREVACHEDQREHLGLYHRVWAVMGELQEE